MTTLDVGPLFPNGKPLGALNLPPEGTAPGAGDYLDQVRDARLTRIIKDAADKRRVPLVTNLGRVVLPAEDAETSVRSSIESFARYVKDNPNDVDAIRSYLNGEADQMPPGWNPQDRASTVIPDYQDQTDALRQSGETYRENHPVLGAIQSVAQPISHVVTSAAQGVTNFGVGALNLFGANISPIDVRSNMEAGILSVASGDMFKSPSAVSPKFGGPSSFDARKQQVQQTDASMELSQGSGADVLQGASQVTGNIIGMAPMFKAAGILGGAAKDVPYGLKMLGFSGLMGAYEGVSAQGEPGKGGATWSQRGEAAVEGAASGALLHVLGAIGKAAAGKILGAKLSSLAPEERKFAESYKRWLLESGKRPVPNEDLREFWRKTASQFIDEGAPGVSIPGTKLIARAVQASVEGAGFSTLDAKFWTGLTDAFYNRDKGTLGFNTDKLGSVAKIVASNALGVLAMHMPLKDIPSWQRWQQWGRGEAKPQPQEPAKPQEPGMLPAPPAEQTLSLQAPPPEVAKQPEPKSDRWNKALDRSGMRTDYAEPIEKQEAAEQDDYLERLSGEAQGVIRLGWDVKRTVQDPSYAKPEMNRDWLSQQSKKFEGRAFFKVGATAASSVMDWFPENSPVRVQLQDAIDNNGGTVTINAKDAHKFIDYYARRAERKRSQMGTGAVDSADSFARKMVEAFGLESTPPRGEKRGPAESSPAYPLGEPSDPTNSKAPRTVQGPQEAKGDLEMAPQEITQPEAPQEPEGGSGSHEFTMPGTKFSYVVNGEKARPSPELRKALGLPEEVPTDVLHSAVEKASLLSALQAKAILPGTEVSAEGVYADERSQSDPGTLRKIVLGDVLEAPLGAEQEWAPAKTFPARGKDPLPPYQTKAVQDLKGILNGRDDLGDGDRHMLSGIIDVMDSVSAEKDQAVAETVHSLPIMLAGMAEDPKTASACIKATAEMLTTKAPPIAAADMRSKTKEPKRESLMVRFGNSDYGYNKDLATGEILPSKPMQEALGVGERMSFDDLQKRLGESDVGKQAAKLGPGERLGGRKGEEGSWTIPDWVGDAARGAAAYGKDVAKGVRVLSGRAAEFAKQLLDTTFKDRIDEIAAKVNDPDFTNKLQEVNAYGGKFENAAKRFYQDVSHIIRKSDNRKYLSEPVQIQGTTVPRWVGMVQGDIPVPQNTPIAEAIKGIDKCLRELWDNQFVGAGGLVNVGPERGARTTVTLPDGTQVEKTSSYVKATPRQKVKVPRVYAEGYDRVLADEKKRASFFAELERLNPDVVDQNGNVVEAGVKAKNLEKDYQDGLSLADANGVEHEAAQEQKRWVKNVPANWGGEQILEHDPVEALSRIIHSEAWRNATIKVFGQSVGNTPEEVKQVLGVTSDREGIDKRAQEAMSRVRMETASDVQEFGGKLKEYTDELQGRAHKKTSKWLKNWNRGVSLVNSMMTVKAFVPDVPSAFTETVRYAGVARMAKAVADVVRHYPMERDAAEAAGALMHDMGNNDILEATDPVKKVADFFNYLGTKSEKAKTVLYHRTAQVMLDGWLNGRRGRLGEEVDRQTLIDDFMFSRDEADQLISGGASDALEGRFIRKFVTEAASRGRNTEQSRAATNPYFRALIWLSRTATKRLYGLSKAAKSVQRVLDLNSTPMERAAATVKLMRTGTGITLGGLVGVALTYTLNHMLRGDNPKEIVKQITREAVNYPEEFATKVLTNQTVFGGVQPVFDAASGNVDRMKDVVGPIRVASRILDAIHGGGSHRMMLDRVYQMANAVGLPPLSSELKDLADWTEAVINHSAPELLGDRKILREFDRLNNTGHFEGDNKKADAYNAMMAKIKFTLDRENGTPEEVMAKIRDYVTAAEKEEPGSSVAESIRSMKMVTGRPKEEQNKLMHFVDDDKRWSRMLAHDSVLDEIAKKIGREPGTNKSPWEGELNDAAKQASLGKRNAWGSLIERVVGESKARLAADQPEGEAIDELAKKMAMYPESLQVESYLRPSIQDNVMKMDEQTRYQIIKGTLTKAAHAGVVRDIKQEAKDRAREQRKAEGR